MRMNVRTWVGLVVAVVLLAGGARSSTFGEDTESYDAPTDLPRPNVTAGHVPPADEYFLEDGYALELVTPDLTFPTTMTFGPAGEVYVVEGGYSYGPATAIPRIMEVADNGSVREVARLPDGPLTGIVHHNASLYVVGGRDPAEVWRVNPDTGNFTTVVTGFPVWGHHFTSQMDVGPDGKLHFTVGYPSNAGVIGVKDDYYEFEYLAVFPEAHDIPCEGLDLTVRGVNYVTENPFTDDPDDNATTGAFRPFNTSTQPGERLAPQPPPGCNGALFSVNPDGTDLEVVAQGLRNGYGVKFAPDGRLFVIDQGIDNGGSRPIANQPEPLWEIQEGGWYGFPDYPSGFPVTLPGYAPAGQPDPEPVFETHPPLAGRPFYLMVPSAGAMQMDFSPGGAYGHAGELFIAQYGSQFHSEDPRGYRVIRLNMTTKVVHDVYINHEPGVNGTAPERPMAVFFHPDTRTLYLLDFGTIAAIGNAFYPSPLSGALWRITPAEGAGDDAGDRGAPAAGLAALAAAATCAAVTLRRHRRPPPDQSAPGDGPYG